MVSNEKFENALKSDKTLPYRELIGGLLHAMVYTRPDISFAVSLLSTAVETYSNAQWNAAKRVLKYLNATKEYGIKYSRKLPVDTISLNFEVYVDASDLIHPVIGYVIKLAGGAIAYKTKKNGLATLSSAESEYVALTAATQEVLWLRELMRELGFNQDRPTKVYEDNQACIAIANNPVLQGRTKHLGRRLQFVRDAIENQEILLEYCETRQMVADTLTKALSEEKFCEFRSDSELIFKVGVLEMLKEWTPLPKHERAEAH